MLCACSVADFKQPITAFSDATKTASATFDAYANSLDEVKHAQNISDILSKHAALTIPPQDCRRQSKQCRLFISTGGRTEPLKSSLLPNVRKIMAGLVVYSGHLNAIAAADTAGEVKTAIDGTKANLIDLAKATDTLSKQLGHPTAVATQISGLATPLADAATVALTAYLEHVKLQALREATARMELIFPQVAQLFTEVGFSDADIKTSNLFAKFNDARDAFAAAPSKDTLAALETAADAYNAALTAQPGAVFIKLSDAHTALAEALRMPNPSFEQVFAFIQQIADAATKLASDAKAIDQVLRPQQRPS